MKKINQIDTRVGRVLGRIAPPQKKKKTKKPAPQKARAKALRSALKPAPSPLTEDGIANIMLDPQPVKLPSKHNSISPPASSHVSLLNLNDVTTIGSTVNAARSTVLYAINCAPVNGHRYSIRKLVIDDNSITGSYVNWRDPPFAISDFDNDNDKIKLNGLHARAHFEGSTLARLGAFVSLNPPEASNLCDNAGNYLNSLLSAHSLAPSAANHTAIIDFVQQHRFAKRYPVANGSFEESYPVDLSWQTLQWCSSCMTENSFETLETAGGIDFNATDRFLLYTGYGNSNASYLPTVSFSVRGAYEVHLNDRPGLMNGVTLPSSEVASNVVHTFKQAIFHASSDPTQSQTDGAHKAVKQMEHKAGRALFKALTSKKGRKYEEEGAMGLATLAL